MTNFELHREEMLKGPEFRHEHEALRGECRAASAMIRSTNETGTPRTKTAERGGLSKQAVKQVGSGERDFSLRDLSFVAKGYGKEVHIEFR